MTTRTIDTILDDARKRLRRLGPKDARAAWASGALLIDIRPSEQRRRCGEIPGATILERNVLEWRLDPSSPDRIDEIESHEQQVILVCQEGYASSLAAASLQDLGLVNATDLDGGIAAWAAAGLPLRRGSDHRPVYEPASSSSLAALARGAGRGARDGGFSHSCRYC